ncbi:hypothetical protein BaRGS_00028180 [Batillaria attramentaria]|uniref:CCHC-type domain-containing protein n=1 Tax=Batillaria attramentaria TaxID=370345 RepID=A0ABD0K002_9CAEN
MCRACKQPGHKKGDCVLDRAEQAETGSLTPETSDKHTTQRQQQQQPVSDIHETGTAVADANPDQHSVPQLGIPPSGRAPQVNVLTKGTPHT